MEKQFLLVRIIWLASLVLHGLQGRLLWIEALVNHAHSFALILTNCGIDAQTLISNRFMHLTLILFALETHWVLR